MPQIFRIGGYLVFFWSNGGIPSEPIHVHVVNGDPSGSATKIWITKAGHCLLCHNNSEIPEKVLRNIMDIIEVRSFDIMSKWKSYFGDIKFYC